MHKIHIVDSPDRLVRTPVPVVASAGQIRIGSPPPARSRMVAAAGLQPGRRRWPAAWSPPGCNRRPTAGSSPPPGSLVAAGSQPPARSRVAAAGPQPDCRADGPQPGRRYRPTAGWSRRRPAAGSPLPAHSRMVAPTARSRVATTGPQPDGRRRRSAAESPPPARSRMVSAAGPQPVVGSPQPAHSWMVASDGPQPGRSSRPAAAWSPPTARSRVAAAGSPQDRHRRPTIESRPRPICMPASERTTVTMTIDPSLRQVHDTNRVGHSTSSAFFPLLFLPLFSSFWALSF